MKTHSNLWHLLCSFDNLYSAYQKASKHKTFNPKVIEFAKNWKLNLCLLLKELRDQTYKPLPLKKFVLRDPKTRVICVSDFRDRIVHHALINILRPIFEPSFIYDSHASRKGKGVLSALNRFDLFKRQILGRSSAGGGGEHHQGPRLKWGGKHYFETVDHQILLNSIRTKVKDENVLWLARIILDNYATEVPGKGMPLGNWTSQFLANVYLNELDQFVKHTLKAKYYLRYVDDFVILHRSRKQLESWKQEIDKFLKNQLQLELHPQKCKIIPLNRGVGFLGFRIFHHHKLVRTRNLRKIRKHLSQLITKYQEGYLRAHEVLDRLQAWNAYAMQGNTYRLRQRLQQETEQALTAPTKTNN